MTVTHASAPPGQTSSLAPIRLRSPPWPLRLRRRRRQPGVGRQASGWIIVGSLVVIVVFFVAVGAVIYGIGSLVQARDQRALMATERLNISNAAVLEKALDKVNLPTQPPVVGQPVGVLAIPALGINQAVVEGVGSSQTVLGPGHVPGTAGLGQPGNAAVVGRNAGYGGVFGRLSQLKPRRQGPHRHHRRSVHLRRPSRDGSNDRVRGADIGRGIEIGAAPTVTLETLYRHTSDNRLTLITSASSLPLNSSRAIEVTAILRGKPYMATPQAARNSSQLGNTGESGAWAELVLSLQALAVIAVGAVLLYRRCSVRTAYLLSTAPLVAFTVLAAESISRLLPAWM